MAEQNLQGSQDPAQGGPNQTPPAIDYAKIQQMLEGTLAAKEDTALKAYFKQQGMSEEEMKQAGVPDWYVESCKKIKAT